MKVLLKNGEIREVLFEEQHPDVFGADAELKQEGRKAFWHTSAHVLAQAVKHLYPDAKCAGGSAIEKGFYYDFDFGFPFAEEHLQELETEMRQIIRKSLSLQVYTLSLEEAKAYMEEHGECYQLEFLRDLPGEEAVSFYRQGEYAECCEGPHISNTSQIKAIRLLSVAGAYWKGDEHEKMLTRIYGISFPRESQLDSYLHMLQEAKARDHRKLVNEHSIPA